MSFERAVIRVEREQEFGELRNAIDRALGPERVETLLKRVQSNGIRIRQLEAVLAKRLLEQGDEVLSKSGNSAQGLYQALTASDQGQMREFYLSRIEEVEPRLRTRFHKLYQYY